MSREKNIVCGIRILGNYFDVKICRAGQGLRRIGAHEVWFIKNHLWCQVSLMVSSFFKMLMVRFHFFPVNKQFYVFKQTATYP